MDKICESCGMPMKITVEFGGKNPKNKYCIYCTDENGNLKSFGEKLKDMTDFIMRTTSLDFEQAQKMATENMKDKPAWKEHF